MTAAAEQPIPGSLLGALLHDADGEVSPDLKSKAGRALARHRWSRVPPAERSERTAPGREAAWQKWLKLVDPEGQLPAEVRERMAREARSAHMTALVMARHHGRKRQAPLVVSAETVALFRDGEAGGAAPLHGAPGGDAA